MTVVVVSLVSDRVRFARADLLLLFPLAAFVSWTALSALWSPGAQLPIQGAQLALVYLAAVAAFLLLDSLSLPLGILCAITPVAAYSLATRLVPDGVGTYNPTPSGYLLAGPTGYQNCLGILCALAALIASVLVSNIHEVAFCRRFTSPSVVVRPRRWSSGSCVPSRSSDGGYPTR